MRYLSNLYARVTQSGDRNRVGRRHISLSELKSGSDALDETLDGLSSPPLSSPRWWRHGQPPVEAAKECDKIYYVV